MKIKNAVVAGLSALMLGNAQAALFDRGGGLIYDDVLNVTWLQDANYAKTSGYDADGRMSWNEAKNWAGSLTFHDSIRSVDYSDWRLARNNPVNGLSFNSNYSTDGSTDTAYNIKSPFSELSYMYYVNLGLTGQAAVTGPSPSDWGVFRNRTVGGQANVGLVRNLQSDRYWSGTADVGRPTSVSWSFATAYGVQMTSFQSDHYYAWAVRDGDVASVAAPVPEPETYAMMLAGLGLLGLTARRRKQSQH